MHLCDECELAFQMLLVPVTVMCSTKHTIHSLLVNNQVRNGKQYTTAKKLSSGQGKDSERDVALHVVPRA